MKNEKKRWFKDLKNAPFISAGLTALCYLIIYISWGHSPGIDKIIIFQGADDAFWSLPVELKLPWEISRLWDIIIIPLFVYTAISLFTYLNRPKNRIEELYIALFLNLIFGLIVSFWFVTTGGLSINLKICFFIGLIINSVLGLIVGLKHSFIASLRFGLTAGLTASLVIGSITGLKIGFLISLIIGFGIFMQITLILGAFAISGSVIKFLRSDKFIDLINKVLTGQLT